MAGLRSRLTHRHAEERRRPRTATITTITGWDPLTRLRRRWSRWDTALLLGSLLLLAGAGLPIPGYSVGPGPTRSVDELIKVSDVEVFPADGEVLMATVALHPLSPFRAIQAWLDGEIDAVQPEDVVTPERRALDMENSRNVAVAVALRRLGFTVTERGGGALIERVELGSPAAGQLAAGDVITSVGDRPTSSASDVAEAIGGYRPGDVVRLDVVAAGGLGRRSIELGSHPDTEAAVLGVALRTQHPTYDYPFSVEITGAGVDGNSAGLAFTLGILDVLTRGELTGGRRIGVTGTIEANGDVGPVGSVAKKAIAVREAGGDYLLVPAGQGGEASAHATDSLDIVEVATLDEAIAALGRLGGDVGPLRRRE